MRTEEVDALVIGAGAAGLAAAHTLRGHGREVLVLDAGDRPGGVMRTDVRGGYLFERGPNTIRAGAPLLRLLRQAGLEGALVAASPASRRRCLFHEGRLVPVPLGPLALLRSPLLSARGKLALLGEPFRRRGDAAEESVAEFVSRRLGPEALERLVGPFLVGVYAGDETRLGADAVFPQLVEFERARGSLVLGALAAGLRRSGERGQPGVWSARGGLGVLARQLAQGLGESVYLQSRVRELHRDGDVWRASLDQLDLRARQVVLAADAAGAATLLGPSDPEAGRFLDALPHAPLASVALPLDPAQAREPLQGFGFLVPREAGLELLGTLFMSELFARRAPEGRVLAMAMIGGLRWPGVADASDGEILARLAKGLEATLGLASLPEPIAITRWRRAVPQPGPGHRRQVAALRARLENGSGLALAGGYLDGVAVGDAIASGEAAANRLAAR